MERKIRPLVTRLMLEAGRYPMLTQEREQELARAWRERSDRVALDELLGCHLRLVVKIASGFRGYGLPLADLVAEGNFGLMQAAEKYDPHRGARFSTYAIFWIRCAIREYILRSWSLVKIGTTSEQKKLFFNLRRLKAKHNVLKEGDLAPETVTAIAEDLAIAETEVVEMNRRLSGSDHSLNTMLNSATDGEWLGLLRDDRPSPEIEIGELEEEQRRRHLLSTALKQLNRREREILVERRLTEKPMTLEQLSRRYGVSNQRIRQIEVVAVSKVTATVTAILKKPRDNRSVAVDSKPMR